MNKQTYRKFITMEEFCERSGRSRNNAYEFSRSIYGKQFFHRMPGERRIYADWTAYENAMLKQQAY